MESKPDAYIIKITILTGSRAGKVYYQEKHGYVTDGNAQFFRWETYSERCAKMVCRKLEKQNAEAYSISRDDYEFRNDNGLSGGYITQRERYEPYKIDAERVFD